MSIKIIIDVERYEQSDFLERVRFEPLHILGTDGEEVFNEKAPHGGWNPDLLRQSVRHLSPARYQTMSLDAFVGSEWVGSTEA